MLNVNLPLCSVVDDTMQTYGGVEVHLSFILTSVPVLHIIFAQGQPCQAGCHL